MSERYPDDVLAGQVSHVRTPKDLSVLRYTPHGASATGQEELGTRLLWDFKDGLKPAIEVVSRYAVEAFRRHQAWFRGFGTRYVMCAPRSRAGVPNYPCESVAEALEVAFPFLIRVPNALARTQTILPSRKERANKELHLQTIRYEGPTLVSLQCPECAREFALYDECQGHRAAEHRVLPVRRLGIVLIDDIITRGETSAACREVITGATGIGTVVGFFMARRAAGVDW